MFYHFMLYHSSALEFIIERYIRIVYYYCYTFSLHPSLLTGSELIWMNDTLACIPFLNDTSRFDVLYQGKPHPLTDQ